MGQTDRQTDGTECVTKPYSWVVKTIAVLSQCHISLEMSTDLDKAS